MALLARRVVQLTPACLSIYGVYKAKTDPPHIVWDLDETILYSFSPIPGSQDDNDIHSNKQQLSLQKDLTSIPADRYFEQIDDDFPYEPNVPNTRTYWRPGALTALFICRHFCHQHVFTAAQESYTQNIMDQVEKHYNASSLKSSLPLFDTVLHRDLVSVKRGKDLIFITDRLDRAFLLDDRVKNFTPQHGRNGVQVVPYNSHRVRKNNLLQEANEAARWVGIAFLALLASDVRDILPFFQSSDHQQYRFDKPTQTTKTTTNPQ